MKPQTEAVLTALQAAFPGPVSAISIDRDLGIYRAGARVYELRQLGYAIETKTRHGCTAEYRLIAREAWTGTLGLERTA